MRMIRSTVLVLAALLLGTAGCDDPRKLGDTTYYCDCTCVYCDSYSGGTCSAPWIAPQQAIACAGRDDCSGAMQACNAACDMLPSDLGCARSGGCPTVKNLNACELHSPPRVLAVSSPLALLARINPRLSSTTFTVIEDGSQGTSTVDGEVYIEGGDCPGQSCPMTITYIHLEPAPLTFGGHSQRNVQLMNDGRQIGDRHEDSTFMLHPLTANFDGLGVVDDNEVSDEALANAPVNGSFDDAAGTVNINGVFQSTDGNVVVGVYLVADVVRRPPIAVAGDSVEVQCSAPVHLDGSASRAVGSTIRSLAWHANFGTPSQTLLATGETADLVFPVGTTEVTLRVLDNQGAVALATKTVSVVDDAGPVLVCPERVSAQCAGGEFVASYDVAASDNCGSADVSCTPPSGSEIPAGSTVQATCTATDLAGNEASCQFPIVAADTTSPEVTTRADANGFTATLWPPDHTMRPFEITDCVVAVTDACEGSLDPAQSVRITGITSDEPDDGLGDGDTVGDVLMTGAGTAMLRAERSGTGDGRVYAIAFEAFDGHGNVTPGTCRVQVPHDDSGRSAVEGLVACSGTTCR